MSKVAIIQLDNRDDQALGALAGLVLRNAAYARVRGYHHALMRPEDPGLPVYWAKVRAVRDHLAQGFDIVCWLDSDAVFHNFSVTIESLFEGEQAFIYAGDVPVWQTTAPFNAGVFFAKGDFALKLMDEWLALYPPEMWEKKNGEWICKDPVWAGPAYEQGAFAEKLLPRYRGTGKFKELSWKILQSPIPLPEAFTLHFMGKLRPNSLVYLKYLMDRG